MNNPRIDAMIKHYNRSVTIELIYYQREIDRYSGENDWPMKELEDRINLVKQTRSRNSPIPIPVKLLSKQEIDYFYERIRNA